MDEDELNELVAARAPHALSFFGLLYVLTQNHGNVKLYFAER